MLKALAKAAQPVLESPYVRRIRRNHGLEHATVHVLAQYVPNLSIAGRSDADGFWLMGNVSTEQVQRAAEEALHRMRNGEHKLAIHPSCGTSLLTTGVLVSLAALTGSIGVRRGALQYFSRLPSVILLSIAAIIFSRPLGLQLQEHFTTLGDPGDLQIVSVTRREGRGLRGGKIVFHRVQTRSS
ncbi:MAG: DUF6391 domain-containing protein [Anaerolineae bacterium]|nr:DUF6391 domain-containing protein [Anaerolineae bacterium]MDW8298277.1 DUF6391 domain-containing protein [Anaerolineae bacterium]